MDSLFRTLVLPITTFFSVIIFGTFGYMYFNHINFIDALQLVAVTISTCGLRNSGQISEASKIFDIGFIIVSFTVMIFVFGRAISLIVAGELKGIRNRDKMRKKLEKMKNHFVVCGFGRVGREVVQQLRENKFEVVVIDSNNETEELLVKENIPCIIGSLSNDEILKKAHIDLAQGLVVCADSDVENLFGTLLARTISPTLNIIARVSDPSNESKLKHAGANHVVSPYHTTGQKIASMILNPAVADFLDRALHDQSLEVWFKEVVIPHKSKLIGKTIMQIDLRKASGVIVLAIKRKDGSIDLSPDAGTVINAEDVFICLGNNNQIAALHKLL